MICTYEEYLKQPKAISFEKMQMIHAEMLAEIGANMKALELYDELIKIGHCLAAMRKTSKTPAGLPATTP